MIWLVNFPPIRIKHYPKGYAVEIQKRTWYGRKYWIYIESFSGMEDEPYYFRSSEIAAKEASKHFSWELMRSVKYW